MTWTKDGLRLREDYYRIEKENLTGQYHYDQREAIRHTVFWTPPELTCFHVTQVSGMYECNVQTRIEGILDTAAHEFDVNLKCEHMFLIAFSCL